MSVEAWTITPEYTISGTGPYSITHPYAVGAIRAYVQLSTGRLQLNGTEFSVSPEASDVAGNVTLSPTVAATYAGLPLIIDRMTPDEQGWLAVLGEREAGLAAQLDRMVQATQELRARGAGALRVRGELEPFDWAEGTVPIIESGKPKSGPTATAIAAAQTRATEAAASAAAAAASAAEALAKENSMLRDRGAWATLTLYSPSDIFTSNGTSYITQTAHIASSIAADQAAGRIRVFAAKGDAGPGSGDMLKTENLSGLTNVPQARTNLGLQALAIKAQAAFADIDPAAVITDVETLAANKVSNAFPVAKAVTDYVDSASPIKAWAQFNSVGLSGTYSRTGTLVTVTMAAHGMTTGQYALLNFTSGAGTDGYYQITSTGANTFTVVDSASGATSGNVTREIWMRASMNVASMARTGGPGDYSLTFATPMPDANYAIIGSAQARTNHAGLTLGQSWVAASTAAVARLLMGLPGASTVTGTYEDSSSASVMFVR